MATNAEEIRNREGDAHRKWLEGLARYANRRIALYEAAEQAEQKPT